MGEAVSLFINGNKDRLDALQKESLMTILHNPKSIEPELHKAL
jgi:hypothetical protein